jgi:hypothetical protein
MIIEADTNDADYVTSQHEISDDEENFIKSIIPKLIGDKRYNWVTGDMGNPYERYQGILTVEEIDRFGEYLPYGEYGIHTIESIEILEVIGKEELL